VGSQSQANQTSYGHLRPQDVRGDYNNILFVVGQAMAKMQTATLVKIMSCTNSGGVSPVGYVDVQPLINQIDGLGNGTPHGTIHNLPYLRIQGGANAVIIDPHPGDIGICVFASRDITKVKSTKAQANPGSFRRYHFSDGLYLGGVLNATPTQYIAFTASGVVIHPVAGGNITLDGPVQVNGSVTSTGDVTANGISLDNHVHSGVQTGSGDTGKPV
jgi:hypothetical protein